MSRILVVDDKELMRDSVATTLSRKGHAVVVASGGKSALEKIAQRPPDAVITDLQMPEMDGLALLAEIRKFDEQLPVIFMTAYGTVETAVAAMKQGAFDYITKPFSGDELVLTVERAIEHGRLLRENQILRAAAGNGSRTGAAPSHVMIGEAPAIRELKQRLMRIADSHGTVLITGESGSGKEVAARSIHENSPRREAPFLALNCAALSTSLLESELFGHEKGAFTGADKLRKGRFELADGGTLLLDEISEISPDLQAKLLRVLQERTFERVGSSSSRPVDVRVIATTNRDLTASVAGGSFRQDLFFRLNVLPLHMPPLREHADDIPDLVAHFLKQVSQREGREPRAFSAEALALLSRYPWPGNVRELQNICERAAVLCSEPTIPAELVEPWLHAPSAATSMRSTDVEVKPMSMESSSSQVIPAPAVVCDGQLTLDEIERSTIVATLQHHRGHRQRSAAALGIGVRTLGLKLKKWKEQHLVAEAL